MKIFFLIIFLNIVQSIENKQNIRSFYAFKNIQPSQRSLLLSKNLDFIPTQKPKKLNLFDISNHVNQFITKNNLKLISQNNSQFSLNYNIELEKNRKLGLQVNKQTKNFSLNLKNKQQEQQLIINPKYKNLKEISKFLNDNILKQIQNQKKERKLEGTPFSFTLQEWINKIKDFSEKNQGEIFDQHEPKDFEMQANSETNQIKVKYDDKELFDVQFSDSEDGKSKTILLSNIEDENAKNHHAFFEKGISKLDKDGDDYMKPFLEEALKEFVVIHNSNKKKTQEDLIKIFDNLGFEFEKIPDATHSYNISKNEKVLGQLLINELEDEFLVTFIINQKEIELKLPRSNFTIDHEKLKEQITEEDINKEFLTFEEAVNLVQTKLKDLKCDGEFDTQKQYSFLKTTGIDCGVLESDLELLHIQNSSMNFMHFYLDNDLMNSEYMISMSKERFENKLTQVTTDITSKIQFISDNKDNEEKDTPDTFNMQSIVGKLKTDCKFECTEQEDVSTCDYNTKDEKIKAAKIVKGKNVYKIFFFDSLMKEATDSHISNPVYYLQQNNGYSQLGSIENDLKDFCTARLRQLRLLKNNHKQFSYQYLQIFKISFIGVLQIGQFFIFFVHLVHVML